MAGRARASRRDARSGRRRAFVGPGGGIARCVGAAALAAGEVAARSDTVRTSGRRPRVGERARAVDARLLARGVVGGVPGSARPDVPGGTSVVARRADNSRRRLHTHAGRATRRRPGGSGHTRPAVGRLPSEWRAWNRSSASNRRSRRGFRGVVPRRATRAGPGPPRSTRAGAVSSCSGNHGARRSCVAGLRDRQRCPRTDARDDRPCPRSNDCDQHRRRHRLVAAPSTASVRARRRAAQRGGDHDARAARPGTRRSHARRRVPPPRRSLRRRCRPAGRAATAVRSRRHVRDRRRRRDRRTRSRSGVVRRAGARGICSCNRGARARERAPCGRGAIEARGGARLPRPDRRGRGR